MQPHIVASRNRHAESMIVPKVAIKDRTSKPTPGTKHAILIRCEIDSMSVFKTKGACSTSPHAEITRTARALFTLERTPGRIVVPHSRTLKQAFSNGAFSRPCLFVFSFQPITQPHSSIHLSLHASSFTATTEHSKPT